MERLNGLAPQPDRVGFMGEFVVVPQPVVYLVVPEEWAAATDDRFGKPSLSFTPVADR